MAFDIVLFPNLRSPQTIIHTTQYRFSQDSYKVSVSEDETRIRTLCVTGRAL